MAPLQHLIEFFGQRLDLPGHVIAVGLGLVLAHFGARLWSETSREAVVGLGRLGLLTRNHGRVLGKLAVIPSVRQHVDLVASRALTRHWNRLLAIANQKGPMLCVRATAIDQFGLTNEALSASETLLKTSVIIVSLVALGTSLAIVRARLALLGLALVSARSGTLLPETALVKAFTRLVHKVAVADLLANQVPVSHVDGLLGHLHHGRLVRSGTIEPLGEGRGHVVRQRLAPNIDHAMRQRSRDKIATDLSKGVSKAFDGLRQGLVADHKVHQRLLSLEVLNRGAEMLFNEVAALRPSQASEIAFGGQAQLRDDLMQVLLLVQGVQKGGNHELVRNALMSDSGNKLGHVLVHLAGNLAMAHILPSVGLEDIDLARGETITLLAVADTTVQTGKEMLKGLLEIGQQVLIDLDLAPFCCQFLLECQARILSLRDGNQAWQNKQAPEKSSLLLEARVVREQMGCFCLGEVGPVGNVRRVRRSSGQGIGRRVLLHSEFE